VVDQVQRSASRGQQLLALQPRREEGALALLLQADDADLHHALGEALLPVEAPAPEVLELLAQRAQLRGRCRSPRREVRAREAVAELAVAVTPTIVTPRSVRAGVSQRTTPLSGARALSGRQGSNASPGFARPSSSATACATNALRDELPASNTRMPRSSSDPWGSTASLGHFALAMVLSRSVVPSWIRAMRCARSDAATADRSPPSASTLVSVPSMRDSARPAAG
jgi:hypothetical protein